MTYHDLVMVALLFFGVGMTVAGGILYALFVIIDRRTQSGTSTIPRRAATKETEA